MDDLSALRSELNELREQLMPAVGDLYITRTNTNPVERYGGTWVLIEQKFLYGAAEGATPADGGSSTHVHGLSNAYAMIGKGSSYLVSRQSTVPSYSYNVGVSSGTAPISGSFTGGVDLGGNTNSASNLPPYYEVFIWERTL